MNTRVVLACVALCAAAMSPAGALTIGDAVNRAFANNPDLQKASAGREAALERVRQGRAGFYPSVTAAASYVRLSETPPSIDFAALTRPGAVMPRIAGNPLLQYVAEDNYSGFVRVTQPIFAGGRIRQNYRAASIESAARSAEFALLASKLRVDVVRSFYGVMLARETSGLTKDAAEQLKRHMERIERLMQAGAATEYDHLKTQVQYQSWTPKVLRAQRDLDNAMRRLNILLGFAPGAATEVSGELAAPSSSDTDAPVPLAFDRRPELVLARLAQDSSHALTGIKRSGMMPQMNLQYSYNLQDQVANFTTERDSWKGWWDLRLMLAWDVFTFGRHRAEVRESELREQQAQIEETALRDRLAAEAADAAQALAEAKSAITVWQNNVALARRGYEIAQDKFSNGKVTNLDVLDSHIAVTEARLQYLKSLYDYRVAAAEFARIRGQEELP